MSITVVVGMLLVVIALVSIWRPMDETKANIYGDMIESMIAILTVYVGAKLYGIGRKR